MLLATVFIQKQDFWGCSALISNNLIKKDHFLFLCLAFISVAVNRVAKINKAQGLMVQLLARPDIVWRSGTEKW